MTVIKVNAGACGFLTRVKATRTNGRMVSIEIDSDCEAVADLGSSLGELGLLGLRDILSRGISRNRVFAAGANTLSHAACPVLVAIIKASEVELGLNVPSPVTIEFEAGPERAPVEGRGDDE